VVTGENRLGNNAELFAARAAEDSEVAPVQREHGFNPLPIRQMHQGRIGELYPQAPILSENRGDAGQVGLMKRKSSKGQPWNDDISVSRAREYNRNSHAASVSTGQQVSRGP